MSTVKSKKLQVGTDATATNNFTIYQPATPDGTLRVGVGNADSPTEVGQFNSNGYVPNKAPAFIAYPSAVQTLSTGTWTTLAYNTEVYDTNSNYNSSTYAFTPTVAGYYNFNALVRSTGATSRFYTKFLKNGTANYYGNDFNFAANSLNSNYSALIYMNGSTDSVVAQAFAQGGGGLALGAVIPIYTAFLALAT